MNEKLFENYFKDSTNAKIITEVYHQQSIFLKYKFGFILHENTDEDFKKIIKYMHKELCDIYRIEATKILLDKELTDAEKINKLYFIQTVMNMLIDNKSTLPEIKNKPFDDCMINAMEWVEWYTIKFLRIIEKYDKTRWIKFDTVQKYKSKFLRALICIYDVTGDNDIVDSERKTVMNMRKNVEIVAELFL